MNKKKIMLTAFAIFASFLMLMTVAVARPTTEQATFDEQAVLKGMNFGGFGFIRNIFDSFRNRIMYRSATPADPEITLSPDTNTDPTSYTEPSPYTNPEDDTTSSYSRQYRALLVGVGDYGGSGDLSTAIPSLYLMRDTLIKGTNYNYGNIMDLINDDSEYHNFKDAILLLENTAGDDDVSLIYYTGHGGKEGSRSYLDLYCRTKFYSDDFADKISQIPGYVIVILDCCHNHGFVDSINAISDSWKSKDIITVTCHDKIDYSYGWPDLGYCVFTFAVASSLVRNDDGGTTVWDLYHNLFHDYDNILLNFVPPTTGSHVNWNFWGSQHIEIITGFQNSKPEPTITGGYNARTGEAEYSVEFYDPDGDSMELFTYWGHGSGSTGEWSRRSYSNGGVVTVSHTYTEKGRYNLLFIFRDQHGANSYYTTNLDITSRPYYYEDTYDYTMSPIIPMIPTFNSSPVLVSTPYPDYNPAPAPTPEQESTPATYTNTDPNPDNDPNPEPEPDPTPEPDPVVIVSTYPPSATVDEGETVDFTITTTGGSGNHYYQFYAGDGGYLSGYMNGDTRTIQYTYALEGTYEPDIIVHDLNTYYYDGSYAFATISVYHPNNNPHNNNI